MIINSNATPSILQDVKAKMKKMPYFLVWPLFKLNQLVPLLNVNVIKFIMCTYFLFHIKMIKQVIKVWVGPNPNLHHISNTYIP
jgi:hypothetical protein